MVFEPLDREKHDRAAFSCGDELLDKYLKQQAGQDIENRVAAVYVATADGKEIAGYYSLSQYAIKAGDVPAAVLKKLKVPKCPFLPATLLGRLARSVNYSKQGIGELLLMSALERALQLSKQIASVAVVVDAKDERATRFYSRYGFIEFPDHAYRLFLTMATIEQMFRHE